MKIIVKTVSGQQYPLECEPEINVATLKQLIQDQHNIQVVTGKLVAKGKILDDGEKKISDYGIVEGASVVAMPTKARPAKKEDAKAEAPKPTVTISSNNASAAAAPNADAAPVQPAQTAPPTTQAAPAQAAPAQASSTALPAGVTSEQVADLMGITGKTRELCVVALGFAQGQMEIAASLIFEGFGIQEIQALAARQGGQQQNMGGGAGYDDSGEGDEQMMGGANGGGGNPLADLFNSPHANQIRQRIREDPDFYQAYMSKMAAENPQFYQMIQQNPIQFMNMIMTGNPDAVPSGGMGGGMGGAPGAGMGSAQPQRPSNHVQVTQQEMDAITNLESFGFPRIACLEALRACGGDEQAAANFLLESNVDDEQAMMQAAINQSIGNPAPAAQPQPDADMQAAPAQPASDAQVAPAQPAADAQVAPAQPAADAQAAPAEPANNDGQQQPAADANAAANGDAGEQQQQQPGAADGAGDAQGNPDNNNNNDGCDESAFD